MSDVTGKPDRLAQPTGTDAADKVEVEAAVDEVVQFLASFANREDGVRVDYGTQQQVARDIITALRPHLTPQPNGDVREAIRSLIGSMLITRRGPVEIAEAVLTSGLVVPAGEMERLDTVRAILSETPHQMQNLSQALHHLNRVRRVLWPDEPWSAGARGLSWVDIQSIKEAIAQRDAANERAEQAEADAERLRSENKSLRASIARKHGEPLDEVYTTDGVDIVIANLREARKERDQAETQQQVARDIITALRPHLTPQPDGDVREWAETTLKSFTPPDEWQRWGWEGQGARITALADAVRDPVTGNDHRQGGDT